MVRPRGKSNPMKPTRLLKTSTSGSASVLNLQMAPLGALPAALEEDLESQARASLSLFGFGVHDAVNWSLVTPGDSLNGGGGGSSSAMNNSSLSSTGTHIYGYSVGSTFSGSNGVSNNSSSSNGGGSGNANSSTSGSGSGSGVTLLERVCPIGTNPFLWNTMNMGESGASGMSSASLLSDPSDSGHVSGMNPGEDDPDWDPLSSTHFYGSKILQQYLVKCVAVIPASVEEVVDLIIRSDRDDMDTPMHHLVGIKLTAAGVIYRRKRKRARRAKQPRRANGTHSNANSSHSINSNHSGSRRQRSRTPPQSQSHSQPPTPAELSDATSSSDSEDEEDVVVIDDNSENQSLSDLNRPAPTHNPARYQLRPTTTSFDSMSSTSERATLGHNGNGISNGTANGHSSSSMRHTNSMGSMSSSSSSLGSFSSYMDEYRASLTQGQQGNLSLKWVVGEKTGRMFTQRANFCLLDYECVLVNDWEDSAHGTDRPMFVRALQSVYLPQCQPWIEELGVKPTDLQPTGIMVREAPQRPGFVEVQFVASILEKAHMPMQTRRTKLRALCGKIGKLEEVLTSRRLSQSLLAHQPLWVNNRERPVCHCCDAVFNLTRRRHHCRLCGEICCSDCCPKKDVALPEVGTTSVRVCVYCVQKRRHSGDALETPSSSVAATSATLSPMARGGHGHPHSASSSYYMATPPPHHHPSLHHSLSSSSSSSPSDYYLSTASSFSGGGGSMAGSVSGSFSAMSGSSLGDRKPSLASSVFQKFKSSSLGN